MPKGIPRKRRARKPRNTELDVVMLKLLFGEKEVERVISQLHALTEKLSSGSSGEKRKYTKRNSEVTAEESAQIDAAVKRVKEARKASGDKPKRKYRKHHSGTIS